MNFKKLLYINKDWLTYIGEDVDQAFVNMSDDSDDLLQNGSATNNVIPVLSINNFVLYPNVIAPLMIRDNKMLEFIKQAYKDSKTIGLVAQNKLDKHLDSNKNKMFTIGTTARVMKILFINDNTVTAILHGKQRFLINSITNNNDPIFMADVDFIKDTSLNLEKKQNKALIQSIKEAALDIIKYVPDVSSDVIKSIESMSNTNFLIYFLASNLNSEIADKQKLLETNDKIKQAKLLLKLLLKDLEMLQLKQEIHNKVHIDIDQKQRRYYLKQHIKALQDELGEEETDYSNEVEKLRAKAKSKNLPKDVMDYVDRALTKAENMNPNSSEYPLTISHTELLISLPWNKHSKDKFDLKKAKKVLDNDHNGLEKVKDRIIEYLAVLKLKQDIKGPILCLYGPPGVGKTSLGKSIAKALNKKYCRIALGGISDDAEIVGHRKTYIGAMPGKIIYNLNKVQVSNPVMVLDEIDKLDSRVKGDPASAMLQVLDPEQNNQFVDNYVELPYDLSKVLFIATANSLDTIPYALRDRLEVIEVNGYTLEEKVIISKDHLIPKQRKEHGLKTSQVKFDDAAIVKIIECYTSESGVRELNRKISSIIRKVVKAIVIEEEYPKVIDEDVVVKMLGPEVYDAEMYEDTGLPGVAIGLAWSVVGGSILFIESSLSKGKGKLTLSGQLGDVMKESAELAFSYIKANANELGIDYTMFNEYDLHIHVPAGSTPKDGPSAGITLMTSIASLYTKKKVRNSLAMTGEITLRGAVLPVGGIKEKILAAKRANIKEIVLSSKNKKDIHEIKPEYISDLKFHYVDHMSEVLKIAL